jgi:5'-nucleotidase
LGGDIEIDVMNALKFDVVTLGNHEFDNGIPELARRLKSLKADVVCSNYDFSATPLEGLVEPYTIIRKAGRKIGFIGLLTDIMQVVDRDIAKALQYQDPVAVVNELADFLKDEKGCDMVICLSHLGYGEDKDLASRTEGVDIIVGGHTHTLLHKKQVVKNLDGEDVIVVQNWKWGLNAGHLTIDF